MKKAIVTIGIHGIHKSGKTVLARMIYRHLSRAGIRTRIVDDGDRPCSRRLKKALRAVASESEVVVRTEKIRA